MTGAPSATEPAAQTQEQKKSHTGSRALVALAFTTLGFKLGTIGTVIDAKNLLREEPTLGKKIWAGLNGTLVNKLWEDWKAMKAAGVSLTERLKPVKYSIIVTGIAMIAGGVLGWIRGNRVEHASDIIVHPIKSLKLVFGSQPRESEKTTAVSGSDSTVTSEPSEYSTHWRARASEAVQPEVVAVGR